MDKISPQVRSKNMSAIRSSGNRSTELALLGLLKKSGLNGWRRHQPIEGKPDFVWRRNRVTLFVDGCFWHGCPRCYRAPRSRVAFWQKKVRRNKARDLRVTQTLWHKGWRVIRIWECEIAKTSGVRKLALVNQQVFKRGLRRSARGL